jgi:hypothetical protein
MAYLLSLPSARSADNNFSISPWIASMLKGWSVLL